MERERERNRRKEREADTKKDKKHNRNVKKNILKNLVESPDYKESLIVTKRNTILKEYPNESSTKLQRTI